MKIAERIHIVGSGLAALSVDGLYPGHLTFAVNNGRRQVEKGMDYVRRLLPPPQLQ